MKKKIIGILIVTLLIITLLPLVSGDNPVLLKTIIVPDDYPTIQKAINNANDEDTIIVRAGTYYENLVVDKSIILSGENRDTTIIDGGENSDVVYVSADYVTITGFTVTNSATSGFFYSGINLNDISNINISGNIISNNMRGINIIFTENSVIHDNIFINDGIVFDGGCKFDFDHDVQGNTINGKPLYYYKYKNDFTVPTDAGQVILYNCDNVMIKDMNIDNTDCAIQLTYCDGCVIKDSYLSNIDVYGIMVDYTNRLTIQENNLDSSGSFGMILSNSEDCIVENNTLTGNTWVGISLYIGCLDNVISDNNIELDITSRIFDFPSIGIWVRYYCNFNNFIGNKISNCHIGLWMESSDQNTIERNLIEECHIATTQQTETSINDLIVKIKDKKILPMTRTKGVGIFLLDTSDNNINFNTIKNNDIGIVLIRSWLDNIRLNNIQDSTTGIDFISLLSLGYYPLNYWGSSVTGPIFKSNRFFSLIPWSPIPVAGAP